MTPFCRVRWTEPDEDRRMAARNRAATRDWHRRFLPEPQDPDLDAVITHHGVLMSEAVYVPGHLEPDEIVGSLPSRHTRVIGSRWICIVATAHGNREMNPLDLTVTGVWVPGEPIEPEAA